MKISIADLNVRKGSGTDYAKTGQFTGKGVFTITEVYNGPLVKTTLEEIIVNTF